MPDSRFFITRSPLSAEAGANAASARLVASTDREIVRVASLDDPDPSDAALYVRDAGMLAQLGEARPAALLFPEKMVETVNEAPLSGTSLLACTNARASFALLAAALHDSRAETMAENSGQKPEIDSDAKIADSAVIGEGASIGAGCIIGEQAVIGPGVVIGEGSWIGAHVSISHAILGPHCRILSGARIGEAGFGFVMYEGRQLRVPQLGRVIFGEGVEIGANTTVDRGALGDTMIGDFSKIDNLVQIGHNTVIGKGCAFAAMSGISGSCRIGDNVLLGGQVGVGDHVAIGDGAIIYACSALMKDVPAGETWGGAPAKPARQWLKEVAMIGRLGKGKAN